MVSSLVQIGDRKNPVSLRPSRFTSTTDRVALSRAAGSLEEALDGAAALKDERFVSVSTRQMPLDVWNVMKSICWTCSRGNTSIKRSAAHSVIVEKGALILRSLPEYRELGGLTQRSLEADYRRHREFSFNQLDYRFSIRDFRNYKVASPISLKCQSGTKELIEELAERYHTSISLIAGMSVISAFTKIVDEETAPRELVELCNGELESFEAETRGLATPIRD